MKKVIISTYYDNEDQRRTAEVYHDVDHYVVDFIEDGDLVKSVVMQTNGVYHSLVYAESAAENWCMGVM